MGRCDHCQAPILWATTKQGDRLPIDREPVGFEAVGLVAYNPATQGAIVLVGTDLGKVPRWKQLGATLHRRHTATCPNADQYPADGQLTLAGGGS